MRKITPKQITFFMSLLTVILISGITLAVGILAWIPLGEYRGVVTFFFCLLMIYLVAFTVYRIFLHFYPLQEGEIEVGSAAEFSAQVNILFYLLLFNSLIRTHFIPVPIMRLVYLALGAKLGENTYSAGTILDPALTELGDNCIIGHDAVLFSHAIEGSSFALLKIKVDDNVTIGAHAIIMAGVVIEEGAIVSAGSVVLKNTRILKNEIWGGIPAKKIK